MPPEIRRDRGGGRRRARHRRDPARAPALECRSQPRRDRRRPFHRRHPATGPDRSSRVDAFDPAGRAPLLRIHGDHARSRARAPGFSLVDQAGQTDVARRRARSRRGPDLLRRTMSRHLSRGVRRASPGGGGPRARRQSVSFPDGEHRPPRTVGGPGGDGCGPHRTRSLATWHFLTSDLDTLNTAWRAYGVSVNVSRTSGFVAHSDVMYFIDPSGHPPLRGDALRQRELVGSVQPAAASISRWGQGIATYARQMLGVTVVSEARGPPRRSVASLPTPEPGAAHPPLVRRRAVLVAGGRRRRGRGRGHQRSPHPDVAGQRRQGRGQRRISEINTDVAPCLFSLREALTLYGDETTGTLSAAHRAQIPGLLRDDQTACSYTNDNIFELSDIDVPGSRGGQAGQPRP